MSFISSSYGPCHQFNVCIIRNYTQLLFQDMTDCITSDHSGGFHEWVFTTAFTSVSTPTKHIVPVWAFLVHLVLCLLII